MPTGSTVLSIPGHYSTSTGSLSYLEQGHYCPSTVVGEFAGSGPLLDLYWSNTTFTVPAHFAAFVQNFTGPVPAS